MSGDRREEPYGRTAAFVAEILASGGSAFVKSWLAGGLNCDFTFDTIYTTALGRDRLIREHYSLAYRQQVRIRKCDKVTKRFYEAMDKRARPQQTREPPSYIPGERQKQFKDAMQARLRPGLFEAIFDAAQIRYAGDDLILVRAPIWQRVLERDGADALAELGLTVRFCGVTFADEPPPKGEPATEEQRAHIAKELRALAASMRKPPETRGASPLSQRFANVVGLKRPEAKA